VSEGEDRSARRWLLAAGLAAAVAIVVVSSSHGERSGASSPPAAPSASEERPPPPPVPSSPPPAAPAPPAAAVPVGVPAAPPSEEALLERLRALADSRPAAAVEAARDSERLHPGGRHADERSYLKMRALVHLGDISAAREEAYLFHERHPGSPYAERVQRLTGLHPPHRPPSVR